MPFRHFQNIDVACWEHRGAKLGITAPAICIYHSQIELGRPILLALDELAAGELPAQRTLSFVPTARKHSFRSLRLVILADRAELCAMHIAGHGETATIEMTKAGLLAVRRAFDSWFKSAEDFCVSSRHVDLSGCKLGALDRSSGELWFWGPTMEP